MHVSSRVAQMLREAGVDTVFGLMGDGNLYHLIAFIEEQGGEFISTASEAGAISMADGLSRTTASIGVASVTHGPGMTNSTTALTEAVKARSRLMVLTGDTPPVPHHLQSFDLQGLTRLTGANYVRIQSAETAGAQMADAIQRLIVEPLPVVIDVPLGVALDDDAPAARIRSVTQSPSIPDEEGLDKALGIIASARKPVILAGRGAFLSNAREELLHLAGILGAPLATTLLARGMFNGEGYDLGISGTVGSAESLDVLQESDCLVSFGASLNRFTLADGAVGANGSIVQIDDAISAIGRYTMPQVALIGDARETAFTMRERLNDAGFLGTGWRERRVKPNRFAEPALEPASESGQGLDLRAAVATLNDKLPVDRLVVTDTGRFIYSVWPHFDVSTAGNFVHTLNFASIGLGLSTGIGVSVAHRDELTVVFAGDGGMMMSVAELATAVRERLPMLIVVANDSAYGMEYFNLAKSGLNPDHSRVSWPRIADVATAYGVTSYSITDLDQLRIWVEEFQSPPDRPVLIELKLDPDTVYCE